MRCPLFSCSTFATSSWEQRGRNRNRELCTTCKHGRNTLLRHNFSETVQLYSRMKGDIKMGTEAEESPNFHQIAHSYHEAPSTSLVTIWKAERKFLPEECVKSHTRDKPGIWAQRHSLDKVRLRAGSPLPGEGVLQVAELGEICHTMVDCNLWLIGPHKDMSCVVDVWIVVGHPVVIYSLHSDQL